ncbi:medial ring protein Alm1 [Schizosaccharomyces cryophilus OY26]|uniref:Medial ring protein Alm1 n=1 Tax=Schizosaccharomyces cryophilus (strain OY26 / ATCC MYA-4695 / CBS 11777 / NBRC 106824 / NRRL Y48691) TaxID=653667 RepID=S9W0N4_SCHCR|nr:medial ring protein Alm1 [Schizosaccharomyces cryophilus OY26]EPY53403.1 medial ring protein Alm1 [Schizosaccharomyces cryophilus OY26]
MASGEHEDDVQFVHERFGVSPEDLKPLAKVPSFSVLVVALRSKVSDMNSLKEQMVLQEVNSEHKQNVSNRRVLYLEEQLNSRNEIAKQFQEKVGELQKDIDASNKANQEIQSQLNFCSQGKDSLVVEKQQLDFRILNMEKKLSDSEGIIRSLQEERQNNVALIKNLQQQMQEMEETHRNLTLTQSSSTLREELYLQEKNALISDMKRLQDENKKMTEELASSEQSQNMLQEQVTALKTSNFEMKQKYMSFVNESQTNLMDEGSKTSTTTMEIDDKSEILEDLQKELEAQQNLTALWESQCSELQTQLDKALNNQSVTKGLVSSATIEEQLNMNKGQLRVANETISKLQSEVDRLASELQVTKERREVSPTGVGLFSTVAQKLSASQHPEISFTKVYSDNMRLQQDVLNLQQRLDRANDKFCWFFYQVKQRIPVVQQQREEIARNNVYMVDMSEKLSKSKEVLNDIKQKYDVSKMQQEQTHLRFVAAQVQCRDLTREIQCLLLELDHLQRTGNRSLPQNVQEALDIYSKQPSKDESVLSAEIPTFTSVMDALAQVLQLREKIRSLECDLQIQKKASEYNLSNATDELNEKHEKMTQDLQNELKLANTKMDNFIHERSVLKEMLNMYREKTIQKVSEKPSDPNHSSQTAVDDIEKQFEMYRNEMVATNESLSKRINDLINQVEEMRKELNKVRYREQLGLQRLNVSRENVESLGKEMKELRSLNNYLQEVLNRQDLNASKISEEHVQLKSLCSRMNSEIANLTGEKEVFSKIKERLASENGHSLAERERLMTLVSNLQSLLNEQQRIFSSNKLSFEAKNHETEQIVNSLQNSNQKLEQALQSANDLANAKDTTIDSLHKRIEELNFATQDYLKIKGSLEVENKALQSELNIKSTKLEELQTKLSNQRATTASEREAELVSFVNNLRMENSSLQTSLDTSKDHIKHLEEASRLAEETLEKLQQEYEKMRLSTSKELEETRSTINKLEKKGKDLEERIYSVQQQHNYDNEQKDCRISLLLKENEQLTNDFSAARTSEKELLQKQTLLQQENVKLSEDCRKARESYEKELLRHANAMSNLQKLRNDYDSLLKCTNREPNESDNNNPAEEAKDMSDSISATSEMIALKKQNALLLAQLQTPIDINSSIPNITSEKLDSVLKLSLPDLQAYIKQIFNEVNISAYQRQLISIENKRLKKLIEQSNQIIMEFQSAHKDSAAIQTKTKPDGSITDNSLSRMVKLLNDSNKLLRKKEEELNGMINSLRDKIQSLEHELETQKNGRRELENKISGEQEMVRRVEEENQRLQQHNQQILQSLKENKIVDTSAEDLKGKEELLAELRQNIEYLTTELASAKETIEKLESEKGEASNTIGQLTTRSKSVASAWRTKYDQLVAKSLEKHNQVRQQLSQKTSELESKIKECNTLREKLDQKLKETEASGENAENRQDSEKVNDEFQNAEYLSTQQKLTEATSDLDAAKKEIDLLKERINELSKEKSSESISSGTTSGEELEKKNQALKQAVLKLRSRVTQEVQKSDAVSKQCQELETQIGKLRASLDSQENMLSSTFQIVFEEPLEKIVTSESEFSDTVKTEWRKRQEELMRKIQEDTKQTHERQLKNLRTELEMRNKLKLSMLEKNLAKVREQLQKNAEKEESSSVEITQPKTDNKSNTIAPTTGESRVEPNGDQSISGDSSLKRPRWNAENEDSSSTTKKLK